MSIEIVGYVITCPYCDGEGTCESSDHRPSEDDDCMDEECEACEGSGEVDLNEKIATMWLVKICSGEGKPIMHAVGSDSALAPISPYKLTYTEMKRDGID